MQSFRSFSLSVFWKERWRRQGRDAGGTQGSRYFFSDFFAFCFIFFFFFFFLNDRRESNFRIDSLLFYLFGFCHLHPVVCYWGGFIRKKCVNPLIAKLKLNDNDFVVNEFRAYLLSAFPIACFGIIRDFAVQ